MFAHPSLLDEKKRNQGTPPNRRGLGLRSVAATDETLIKTPDFCQEQSRKTGVFLLDPGPGWAVNVSPYAIANDNPTHPTNPDLGGVRPPLYGLHRGQRLLCRHGDPGTRRREHHVLLEFGIALNEQQPGVEEADLFPAAIAYAKGIYREIRSAKRAARRGSLRGLASRAEGKETPEGAAPGFARRSHGLR